MGNLINLGQGVTTFKAGANPSLVGDITLVAGTNISLSQTGQSITITASGGGGSGATTALDNLALVAINTALLPGTAGVIDLGSGTKQFRDLYSSGQILAADGTSSTLSVAFQNNPNYGMYFNPLFGAGIGIVANGNESLFVGGSGVSVSNGAFFAVQRNGGENDPSIGLGSDGTIGLSFDTNGDFVSRFHIMTAAQTNGFMNTRMTVSWDSLTTTVPILPDSSNAYDLGSVSQTWKRLFLNDQLRLNDGAQIGLDGAAQTSLILHDSGTDSMQFYAQSTIAIKFDIPASASGTSLWLYDKDSNSVQRVTVGAADSGGTGFKVLRIPN